MILFLFLWVLLAVNASVIYLHNQTDMQWESVVLFMAGAMSFCLVSAAAAWLCLLPLRKRLPEKLLQGAGWIGVAATLYVAAKIFIYPNEVGEVMDIRIALRNVQIPVVINLLIFAACLVAARYIIRFEPVKKAMVTMALLLPFGIVASQYQVERYSPRDLPVPENSVFILLFDMASAPLLYDQMPTNPLYQRTFADFTAYPNTIAPGLLTKISLPRIFSGRNINPPDVNTLVRQGIEENGFSKITNAHTTIVYRKPFPNWYCKSPNVDCKNINMGNKKWLVQMYDMDYMIAWLAMKVIPAPVLHYKRLPKVSRYFPAPKEMDKAVVFDGFSMLSPIENAPPEIFLFYSMVTHHDYHVLDAECKFNRRTSSIRTHHKCSLKIMSLFVDRLKQIGRYDSSTIIMMSDHGPALYSLPRSSPFAKNLSEPLYKFFQSGRYHGQKLPVGASQIHRLISTMMIKYPGSKQSGITFDYRPASAMDLMPTICALKGGCNPGDFDGISLLSDEALFKGRMRQTYNMPERNECWPNHNVCFVRKNHIVEFDEKLNIKTYINGNRPQPLSK
jgi:hypothetical protein